MAPSPAPDRRTRDADGSDGGLENYTEIVFVLLVGLLFVLLLRWISRRCNVPFFMTLSFVAWPVVAAVYLRLNLDAKGVGFALSFTLGMFIMAIANIKLAPDDAKNPMMAIPMGSAPLDFHHDPPQHSVIAPAL